jgi:hypothetical protein
MRAIGPQNNPDFAFVCHKSITDCPYKPIKIICATASLAIIFEDPMDFTLNFRSDHTTGLMDLLVLWYSKLIDTDSFLTLKKRYVWKGRGSQTTYFPRENLIDTPPYATDERTSPPEDKVRSPS